MPLVNGPLDWSTIRLVVFDVDGTLYDQRAMRLSMLMLLARHVLASRSLDAPRILREFRKCREDLAETMAPDFQRRQYEMTAAHCGCDASRVQAIVEDWMERKPLKNLLRCRFSGLEELFRAASGQGKSIGILSDYPASEKLEALRLRADIVVSAGDADVGVLKPHPGGLRKLLEEGNVEPDAAIMIGDRVDRDWVVAEKLGVRALIRSRKGIPGVDTFSSYGDGVFQDLLGGV